MPPKQGRSADVLWEEKFLWYLTSIACRLIRSDCHLFLILRLLLPVLGFNFRNYFRSNAMDRWRFAQMHHLAAQSHDGFSTMFGQRSLRSRWNVGSRMTAAGWISCSAFWGFGTSCRASGPSGYSQCAVHRHDGLWMCRGSRKVKAKSSRLYVGDFGDWWLHRPQIAS